MRSSSEGKFLSELSVASSGAKGRSSGVGSYSLFCLGECEAARGPLISAAAQSGSQCAVSTSFLLTGLESVPLSWSLPRVVSLA